VLAYVPMLMSGRPLSLVAIAFIGTSLACGSSSTPAKQAGPTGGTDGGGSGGSGSGSSTNGGSDSNAAVKVSITPPTSNAPPGGKVKFSATVSGAADTGVKWTASDGTIDDSGLFTAPTKPDTYTITATSKADSSAKGTATVNVAEPRSCDNLPEAGVWENISPPGAAEANGLVIDPFDSATVWVGVANGGLHQSTDCGATWTHVNTGMNGAALDSGTPYCLQVDRLKRGVIYQNAFMGSNGLFKSTNNGVDWQQMFPEGHPVHDVVQYNLINSVAVDAHDSDHLIVSMHADCAPPYEKICVASTHNGGKDWEILSVPGIQDGWVAGAGAFIIDDDTWLFGTYYVGIWLTNDDGKTFTNVTPAGAQGSTQGKVLNAPFGPTEAGNYFLPDVGGVLHSKDGLSWSLLPNSGGRTVGLTAAGGKVFTSDQWAPSFHMADETDLATWTQMDPPPGLPEGQGAPDLQYDPTRHILYASTWAGGLWRMVVP
jgi:hypothetical protein